MSAAPGPLGEEAVKLLEALGDWARRTDHGKADPGVGEHSGADHSGADHSGADQSGADQSGADHGPAGHSAGEHAAWFASSLGEAMSDGSVACQVCPVCQLIALVRHARPETFTHLLEASASLAAALRSVVEHAEVGADGDRTGTVQRIDLDPPRAAPA